MMPARTRTVSGTHDPIHRIGPALAARPRARRLCARAAAGGRTTPAPQIRGCSTHSQFTRRDGPDFERIIASPVTESSTWVDASLRHNRSYRYRVLAAIDDEEIALADAAGNGLSGNPAGICPMTRRRTVPCPTLGLPGRPVFPFSPHLPPDRIRIRADSAGRPVRYPERGGAARPPLGSPNGPWHLGPG